MGDSVGEVRGVSGESSKGTGDDGNAGKVWQRGEGWQRKRFPGVRAKEILQEPFFLLHAPTIPQRAGRVKREKNRGVLRGEKSAF